MHIWGNCGHWDNDSSPTQTTAKVIPLKPKKKARPHKPKPLKEGLATFYAWENDKGEIVKQRGFKGLRARQYGPRGADLYCVGDCSKGGGGKNKSLENFVRVRECFSDLDPDFPLDWQEILEVCRKNKIPFPNRVVRSRSRNHYQLHWYIPAVYKDTKEFNLWLLIQEKIFETFRPLGADPLAVKNPIQYLRNPDKYEVVYSNDTKTDLAEFYAAFKKNGSIKLVGANKGHRKRRHGQKSFNRVTLPRLRTFFKENPNIESTHKEIYTRLEIAKATYFYLLPILYSEGLKTKAIRKGKTWITQFTFHGLRKDYLNGGGIGSGVYARELERSKRLGLALHTRNIGVFILALWLNVYKKMTTDRVMVELEGVFLVTVSRTTGFDRKEFEQTVRNACSGRYPCFVKFNHLWWKALVDGLDNLDRQNDFDFQDCVNEESKSGSVEKEARYLDS